jgi:hypothetical protein
MLCATERDSLTNATIGTGDEYGFACELIAGR